MDIDAFGISATLPKGWSGRLSDQLGSSPDEPAARALHAANFTLPPEVASFGGQLMEFMGVGDMFVALVECAGSEWAYKGLYGNPDIPTELKPESFEAAAMPASYEGLSGFQHFCTLAGRPFCLFVVASCSEASTGFNLPSLNELLTSIAVVPFDGLQEIL